MSQTTRIVAERLFAGYRDRKFPQTRLRNAARIVANEEIDIVRDRTSREGVDVRGQRLRTYTSAWSTTKAEIIKQGWKIRDKKGRLKSIKPTAFAANKTNDFLRLSGRLFSDMVVRSYSAVQTKAGLKIRYVLDFRTERSRRIARYHAFDGTGKSKILRRFWGAAERKKDVDRLNRALRKELLR